MTDLPDSSIPPRPAAPQPAPEPGDRPPPGRLTRAPSERYASRAAGLRQGEPASVPAALRSAFLAAVVTAVLIVLVGGVLAEHRGLLAISGLGGAAIGLLVARAATSPDGATPAALTRPRAVRVAASLALATVVVAALGIWAYARLEGGVLDPLTYLWDTTGALIPAQAAIATLTAVWGAGAGPIRWRG